MVTMGYKNQNSRILTFYEIVNNKIAKSRFKDRIPAPCLCRDRPSGYDV